MRNVFYIFAASDGYSDLAVIYMLFVSAKVIMVPLDREESQRVRFITSSAKVGRSKLLKMHNLKQTMGEVGIGHGSLRYENYKGNYQ